MSDFSVAAPAAGAHEYDDAQFLLSNAACTEQDREAALTLLLSAARAGYGPALAQMGDVCRLGTLGGRDVRPPDLRQAAAFYKEALKAGEDDALFGLGVTLKMLHEHAEAAACFYESAYRFGRREALREYGVCVFMGLGVMQDRDKGRRLMTQAALMDPEFSELGRRYLAENFGIHLEMPDDAERTRRQTLRAAWRDSRRALGDSWREDIEPIA